MAHSIAKPITSVTVVGAGGNGSIFLTHLCRIYQAWTQLGGEPFKITVCDPDEVTEANLARQCFCEADLGMNKAMVLAQRMRGFFGIDVQAHPDQWRGNWSDLIVGCVDNLKARREMADRRDHYYLDLGNSENSGQVVLGGHGLPGLFDVYPHLAKAKDSKTLPSCSMAESLARQDLFINSTLATLGGQLVWHLMRRGGLNHHGYVVNLDSGLVLPLKIPVT